MKKTCCFLFLTTLLSTWALGQGRDIAAILGYPQTILHNAKVVTVDDSSLTPNLGRIVQAVAIRDGKILAVGTNDEIRALAGPQTQLIDLKGRTMVPGLIAVHNHPQDWAHSVKEIMLQVVPEEVMVQRFLTGTPKEQIEQFPRVLEEAARAAQPGSWIKIVFLWDVNVSPEDPYFPWAGKRITKELLDRLAPNHPLLVRSRPTNLTQDLSAMMNQKAIDITRKESPPDELATVKNLGDADKTGVVEGVPVPRMVENEVILKRHLDLLTEIFRLDLEWWAALGQTTWGSFLYHHPNVLMAFRNLDRRGQLANRIAWGWGELPDAAWERDFQDPFLVADLAGRQGEGTDYLWYLGTGQIGGGCVSMEPLPNRPKETRLVMRGGGCQGTYQPGGIVWNALYKLVQSGGRIIGSHQFGDVDIDNILTLIARASREAGFTMEEIRSKRHTADHMQGWPRPDQVPILKDLGMIVGGTNLYIYQDSPRWMRDYGEKGIERVVPRKSLIQAGVMSGIEIDKPYEASELNVFSYLSWSITRKAQDGKVYMPNEKLTREEALKTATVWPAYYVLRESLLGSLERGKFADFLVLDQDYLTVPEDQIENIRVLMTAVGGKIVHLAPSLAKELNMSPRGAAVELGGPPAKY